MAAARSARERQPLQSLTAEDEAKLDEGLGFDMTAGSGAAGSTSRRILCRRLAPMDRLVFGDVGFGKTEMAIQAALLAVRGGRQVAVGRGVPISRRGGGVAMASIGGCRSRWRRRRRRRQARTDTTKTQVLAPTTVLARQHLNVFRRRSLGAQRLRGVTSSPETRRDGRGGPAESKTRS